MLVRATSEQEPLRGRALTPAGCLAGAPAQGRAGPVRRVRRILPVATAASLLVAVFATLALAPMLLYLRDPLAPADAIVVLGGDAYRRTPVAAEIFRQGFAPLVLVSGTGDCGAASQGLQRFGVPSDHVLVECASRTTRENALFSDRMLHERGVGRIILVTSWQHAARAARSFAALAPDLSVISYPTRPAADWLAARSLAEAVTIFEEYAKSAWYCVGYAICP